MSARPNESLSRRHARGFGAVLALIVLVMLAAMGAAIVRLSWTQQMSDAEDVSSARAQQAANAGVEWGLYQALQGSWTACAGGSQTLDLRSSMGVWVTVTCTLSSYVEGQTGSGSIPTYSNNTVRVYLIDAVACNGTSSCPDATAAVGLGYVERRRQAQVIN